MPAATYQKYQQYIGDLHNGVHNFGSDQLSVALTNTTPNLSTHTQFSDIGVVASTNFSGTAGTPAGAVFNVTTSSSGQTGGTYDLVLNDLTISATGTTALFRYAVLFNNATVNDDLICVFDYGSSFSLGDGESFTIDFEQDGGTTGSLFTAT